MFHVFHTIIIDRRRGIMSVKKEYKPLDLSILKDKNIKVVSSKEALKDVEPIVWGTKGLKESSSKCAK